MSDKVSPSYIKKTKVNLVNIHCDIKDPESIFPQSVIEKAKELADKEMYLEEILEVFNKEVFTFWKGKYEINIYNVFDIISIELHEGDPYPKYCLKIANYKPVE